MSTNPNESGLFETPRGVRVIPSSELLDDPGATMAMEVGDLEESEQLLRGFDPEALIRNTKLIRLPVRPHTRKPRRIAVFAPGPHFVYSLIVLVVSVGTMGLGVTLGSPGLVGTCFVTIPVSFVWCLLRFRAWLNSRPYWYRLMDTLGEDAENLRDWRLRRAFLTVLRVLYA